MKISGLHHVTAIASDPQRNLDFYAGVLGMRLVKRTVNFDDPANYHFYFADAIGTPGTVLTFFPWPHARRGRHGAGETAATAFAIPRNSLGFWADRLKTHGVAFGRGEQRFGEEILRFEDPDGMAIELIPATPSEAVHPWTGAGAPEEHALRGFHGVTLSLLDSSPTIDLLANLFGYRHQAEAGGRVRLTSADETAPGHAIDLLLATDASLARPAAGSVHHIAFRAPDGETQAAWREKISALGFGVSPIIDRTYFHSIYFREPGGVLFEIATDRPGFTSDETPETLGSDLCLPSWLERSRDRIEAVLPAITVPTAGRP